MAQVYVKLLYAGKRTWEQVPDSLKKDAEGILKSDVARGFITPERYTEITGGSYVGYTSPV